MSRPSRHPQDVPLTRPIGTSIRAFHNLAGRPQPDTIVIAGLGRGDEVAEIRSRMPKAKIIGVEPLEELPLPSFEGELVQKCLWSSNMQLTLDIGSRPDQRASVYELLKPTQGFHRRVEAITLEKLHDDTGPWGHTALLLDAEGAEYEILRGAEETVWSLVCWINVEVKFLLHRRQPSFELLHNLLLDRGFLVTGVHNAKYGWHADFVYIRRKLWKELRDVLLDKSLQRKRERFGI